MKGQIAKMLVILLTLLKVYENPESEPIWIFSDKFTNIIKYIKY